MMPLNGVGLSLGEPLPMGMVIGTGWPSSRSRIIVQRVGEIRPDDVHLVDEDEPRHPILVGLPPHGFRLGLDAFLGVEDDDAAVEDAQAAFDLGGEIDVAGRVDQVDGAVAPV